jgi:ABC-type antimicrobial peptide transport system permease subunit
MLVALESGVDGHSVVEEIRSLDPSVGTVSYVDEILETQQNSAELTGVIYIQQLGIVFAVVAASIGTCLVTIVSLSERRKEISLLSVRGASHRQLLLTLLSETFAVVVFALLLGSAVGFIILRGNVMSTNISIFSPVKKRIILSGGFLTMVSSGYILIFTSLMIPVFLVSRRYMSSLGDALRQR